MDNEIHRDLGKHDAQIESMQKQIDQLHADLGTVLDELQKINKTLSEARGGWKTLLAVGGFASAVTALGMKVVAWAAVLPTPK